MSAPTGMCECGCGEAASPGARFVKGHHLRLAEYRSIPKRRAPVEFVEAPDTNCWIWQLTRGGGNKEFGEYGQARGRPGGTRLAHRLVYEELVGPIPDGLTLDHLCRNTLCVNPGHLEPVTMRENILRGTSPVALNAAKTHCKHGHEFTPGNTYLRPDGARCCRVCRLATKHRYRDRQRAAGLVAR